MKSFSFEVGAQYLILKHSNNKKWKQIPYYIWAESKGRLIRFLVTDKGLNTPSDKSKLVKERGEKSRRELHSLYTKRAAWELGPECKPNSSFLQRGRYPRPGTGPLHTT